ncbi:MAG: DUF3391 domain-containing protein [Gammaproteobacteria bacterium]|nr:DUF3391 domain-containing protein [Gammaproteobacteria bacterium]
MERKVRTGRLKKGMYVSNLDRPWLDTPFLVQGFYINDAAELRVLDQYCDFVFIDTDRGLAADRYWDDNFVLPTNAYLERFLKNKTAQTEYHDSHSASQEMPQARRVFNEVSEQFAQLMEDLKTGKNLRVNKLLALVGSLTESLLRSPDAMLWLSHLRVPAAIMDTQPVDHCILAIAFGRYCGLPEKDMQDLAIGVILSDIGKLNLPDEILLKRTVLTNQEFSDVKKHVDQGYDYLSQIKGIDQDSLNIVLTHHERHDGSGYPEKLSAMQIPVFGRIAGMIDCYQAMITKRPYSEPISSHRALQKIYNWRDKFFQAELVEQFLHCLGVYPCGCLVEMKSGEVGVVISQNKERHTQPQVMLLLDNNKVELQQPQLMNMLQTAASSTQSLKILRALDPGAYGIVAENLLDTYNRLS